MTLLDGLDALCQQYHLTYTVTPRGTGRPWIVRVADIDDDDLFSYTVEDSDGERAVAEVRNHILLHFAPKESTE